MDKLFIDCNILLDWLTDRPPFSQHAEKLLTLIEKNQVEGFVSPLTLSNTYYVLRKQTIKKIANEFLKDSRILFNIIDITKDITIEAIENKFKDFEDDLHYYTAQRNNLNFIITRNKSDFIKDKINILTAEEYLRLVR
ncbi:PIN domain-containing protein [candidate division KSB1 bacterium]|nr:PIN domain-containing protein [candidate division KSB1 bacterium]